MPNNMHFESWGRFPKVSHLGEIAPHCISKINAAIESVASLILPRGQGRSYGDSCLNEGGYLLSTKWLNKFYAFNPNTGLLRCESGVTFDEILQVFVPKGWFLPVIPGTKFITIGGAIANDIHGKNHHKTGSFGNFIERFELERTDGTRILCSQDINADWLKATIGGLGLTGIILWAEFRLKPIRGPYIKMESIKFKNLDEFFAISKESEQDYEYTVSWVDCFSNNKEMYRGIFMRGNHSDMEENNTSKVLHKNFAWTTFPFDAPSFFLTGSTIKIFNFLYYYKQIKKYHAGSVHYDSFFYPLDKINHWNRMYGKRGFLQWQCVVPVIKRDEAIKKILQKITRSKLSSFLAGLKEFGNLPPEGMLSFPMPGTTLALDFPNTDKRLFTLLDELDEIIIDFGGRIYPAKDARMTGKTFHASFPEFKNFIKYVDPKLSSSFYRRVREK